MSNAVAGRETRLRIAECSDLHSGSVVGGVYGLVNCVNVDDQSRFGERLRCAGGVEQLTTAKAATPPLRHHRTVIGYARQRAQSHAPPARAENKAETATHWRNRLNCRTCRWPAWRSAPWVTAMSCQLRNQCRPQAYQMPTARMCDWYAKSCQK